MTPATLVGQGAQATSGLVGCLQGLFLKLERVGDHPKGEVYFKIPFLLTLASWGRNQTWSMSSSSPGVLAAGGLPLPVSQTSEKQTPGKPADGEKEKGLPGAWLSSAEGGFHVCCSRVATVHWPLVPMVTAHEDLLKHQGKECPV